MQTASATWQASPPLRLIQAKLNRPSVTTSLVERPRLVDLLNHGHHLPLTLVSAPAGSGKTTLLSAWLGLCSCRSAWLSLDEDDGSLGVFLGYFVAAIRTVFPGACPQSLALLELSELPPARVVAGFLINDIVGLAGDGGLAAGERLVLVLDDYHMVHSQAVNELLAELLRYPLPTLRLVLATRSDPGLPLATLRARGQVLEVRLQDLRFTAGEAETYLHRASEVSISGEVVTGLMEATEGWITGLHLAALNLRHAPDLVSFMAGLQDTDRYTTDYLVEEVLSHQPAALQEFLLKTSILERLHGPLCEAVTGLAGPACSGQACLEQLERENLFTTSLDGRRLWFRYQHLFRQFLLNRLERQASAAEIAGLHARASAWYAANGYIEDAISHALAAGDEEAVVHLIEAHRQAAMNQEHWQQLERWLRLIPRRLINQHAELLLSEAWILQRQWRLADLPPYLVRIVDLMERAPASGPAASLLRGEVDALQCLVSYLALDGERAYAFARRSLETLPLDYSSVRGLAWMYYAGGLHAMGDVQGAYDALDTGLKEDRFHDNSFPARVLIALCVLNWMAADLASLSQVADRFLKLAGERNLGESVGWARYFRACAAYQANDLASAEADFAAVVEQRYLAHGFPFSQSAVGLASTLLARGAHHQARAVIESVLEYGLETGNTRVLAEVRAFQAYLALAEGRRVEVQRWLDSVDRRAPLAPMTTFTLWIFYLARILVDQRTPASLAEATEVLARLRDFVETTHNTRFKIEVLALQALLDDVLGHQGAASTTLQEAVALARPGGVQRVFLDLGPRMASLLGRLSLQGADSAFVSRLLRGFPPAEPHALAPAPASQARLIEPLTDRELEVLALLVQRLSAKEIAERLVISDRTVKRHTANIYQKLGVNSRRQAAAQATALNLPISPRTPQ